jgi:perosamine synthetase
VPEAAALNSGTAALHLALDALGVGEGDEVIVPTMTFAATAEVVHYLRARPVLVDCEDDTLNISAEAFARAITPRTKAVIPVHLGGHACEMDAILEIARRHGVRVVEDAAHAFPAEYRGRMVGTLSDVTCFSFYATKTITTGEGGMLVSADPAVIDRVRIMGLHGISRDAWKRYTAEGSWYYEILYPGYKYNLTDIAAALGIEQLKKARRFRDVRTRYAALYDQAFASVAAIRRPTAREGVVHAWHLYPIRLDAGRLTIDRDEFFQELKRRNIGASVHFIPLHLHPYYRRTFGYSADDFPVASHAFEGLVSLPIYPAMSPADVHYVAESVVDICQRHRR